MAKCPKTATEAFKRLDRNLSNEDKKAIREAEDTVEFHFTLGLWIRNHRIYNGEHENLVSLMKDLGEPEFFTGDMASEVILEAYQKHLKSPK